MIPDRTLKPIRGPKPKGKRPWHVEAVAVRFPKNRDLNSHRKTFEKPCGILRTAASPSVTATKERNAMRTYVYTQLNSGRATVPRSPNPVQTARQPMRLLGVRRQNLPATTSTAHARPQCSLPPTSPTSPRSPRSPTLEFAKTPIKAINRPLRPLFFRRHFWPPVARLISATSVTSVTPREITSVTFFMRVFCNPAARCKLHFHRDKPHVS